MTLGELRDEDGVANVGRHLEQPAEIAHLGEYARRDRARDVLLHPGERALGDPGVVEHRVLLALATLAHELHGRDARVLRSRVTERVERADAVRETRSIAFMALALAGGAELLRIRS